MVVIRLIKKDFHAYGYILVFQLLVIIAFISFGFFVDSNGTLTMIVMMMYPMVIPTLLLLNDKSYTTLSCSLPVSRTEYVMAKYAAGGLFAMILLAAGLVYGYVVANRIAATPIPFDQLFSLKGISFLFVPVILVNSVTYPVFFAFSKEKGGLFLVILFTVILLTVLLSLVYFEKTLEADSYYDKAYIFPVLMKRLAAYIQSTGREGFILRIAAGVTGFFLASVAASLTIIHHKDIGQTE